LEGTRSDNRVLARLVLIGAAASAVMGTLGNASYSALALGSAGELSDATLMAFVRVDAFTFDMAINMFQALVVVAASAATLRSQGLARWLGWFGLVVGAVLLAAGLWVVGGEFGSLFQALQLAGLVGWAAWIAATAVTMLRAPVEPATEIAQAASP
jgi:hypothetical protein